MKDENSFYKDISERNNRQIKDLKNELRKYEFEIESLANQKHQETYNFINNLPSKTIDRPENNNVFLETKDDTISFRKSLKYFEI